MFTDRTWSTELHVQVLLREFYESGVTSCMCG